MKKYPCLILLALISLSANGQRNSDYGIFGGVSSYMGDINPGRLFYSPLPAGGLFYRYNLHPRHAIRANLFVGGLKGNDLDFNNAIQQTRSASFSGMAGELALQFEFNFLPYTTMGKFWDWTPYFAAGVGVAMINSTAFSIQPIIPFSGGFKVNVYKNLGVEAEYGFRKTFYDNFDGLKDPIDPVDHGWTHNNDWYTFAGIALTWKIYSKLSGCPAYSDVDGKRKR
jgi:hypothetical protein